MDPAKKEELHRRRKLRLEQVRQQSKDIAQDLRCRVAAEKKRKEAQYAKAKTKELKEWQEQQVKVLQNQYAKSLRQVGSSHKQAMQQPDTIRTLQEKKCSQDYVSAKRGKEAMKQVKLKNQEKQNAKPVRKKTVRSVVIASPNRRKIKVTHIIKGNDKSKQRKDGSETATNGGDVQNSDAESDNSDDVFIGDDYCSTSYQCSDKVSQACSAHLCQCCKLENIIKPVTESIVLDNDSMKSWDCKCCKKMRSVGTQCVCVCGKSRTSSISNVNTIDPLVAEHISAMNRNAQISPTKTKDVFTQVSDRIKSRNFVDISNSPKSIRSKSIRTEKIYNPKNFASDSIGVKDTSDSEKTEIRDLSPLAEASNKIQSSVQHAKKHLEDIEPEVVELKRNIDILSRGRSRRFSQITPSKSSKQSSSPMRSDKTRTTNVGAGTITRSPKKTKMYDSNTKFEKEYRAPSHLVEKINCNAMSAYEMARRERENIDKEQLLQSQKQKADFTKSKIRGRKALNQNHNKRNLDKISESLGLLAQQENTVKISQDHGLQRSGLLAELENRRQEEINKAFENVLNEDGVGLSSNIVTLKRIVKNKPNGKENLERSSAVVSVPSEKTTSAHSRLNVGNCFIPHNVKTLPCQKPCTESKSSSSSSSIIVGHVEEKSQITEANRDGEIALLDLLNRVNHQKQMLLEEVSKQDLPQNSKLTDVLDAVERSLVNNTVDSLECIQENNKSITKCVTVKNDDDKSKLEGARIIKKQRKKLAKKEEELKLKELQLDLLIQKQKINELQEKQKCNTESAISEIVAKPKNVDKDNVMEFPKVEKQQISAVNQLASTSSEEVSSGVEIIIKVNDKTKTNNLSTPRKYAIQSKGSSLVQKNKKTTSKRNKGESKSKVTKQLVCETSATSSTSYMSPPQSISNISKFVNLPRTMPKEPANLDQFQQIKQQTNIGNIDHSDLPNAMLRNKYMYEPASDKRSNRLDSKHQQNKENPQLLKYIHKLLSMSRGSIDALTVSSCSDEPTPSDSIINISSNTLKVPQEKIVKPIEKKSNFLDEFQTKIPQKSPLITNCEKISSFTKPYHKNSVSNAQPFPPHKATQTNLGIDKSTQVIKESPQNLSPNIQNKATNTSNESKINLETGMQDASTNNPKVDMHHSKRENLQQLTDTCNQRISNLTDLILQVRREKLRLLESSLSSNSSAGQNSTEYLDLPSRTQEHIITYSPAVNNKENYIIEKVANNIFDESPPELNVTGCFERETFVPMLQDIPKPVIQNINIWNEIKEPNKMNQPNDLNDMSGIKFQRDEQKSGQMRNEISGLKYNVDGLNRQLSSLENCMGKIQEYIADTDYSERHRQKPPVSLLRHVAQIRHSANIDAAQAHELSAILEVETPAQSRISESNFGLITISEELTEKPVAGKLENQSTKINEVPDYMGKLQTIEKRLKNIFDESTLSVALKSPSKFVISSDKIIDTDLQIQPFPTFEEYTQKFDIKTSDDNSNTSNFSYHLENDKSNELNIHKNEETLPDVLSELMRRKVLQQPFDNDTRSTEYSTSTVELFDELAKAQVNVEKYVPLEEHFSKTLSAVSLMSDSSIENSSTTNSTSPDFEKALQKLGLNWALSTLKKTQESMALSSSSSVDYPLPDTNYITKRIMALKKLSEESFKDMESIQEALTEKITIESRCTENSDDHGKGTFEKKEFKDNSGNELSEGSSNLKTFLAQELAKKSRSISLDKEAIFRSLLSGSKDISNTSDVNATLIPSPQTNQRTSTPVLAEKKTSTSSKANSLHDTLFSGSNLSSVKNNSSGNASSSAN